MLRFSKVLCVGILRVSSAQDIFPVVGYTLLMWGVDAPPAASASDALLEKLLFVDARDGCARLSCARATSAPNGPLGLRLQQGCR
jgi:hypothetical protein